MDTQRGAAIVAEAQMKDRMKASLGLPCDFVKARLALDGRDVLHFRGFAFAKNVGLLNWQRDPALSLRAHSDRVIP